MMERAGNGYAGTRYVRTGRRNPRRSIYSRKEMAFLIAGVFVLGIFFGVCLSCAVYLNAAGAEDGIVYQCWILCEPGSEVLIRERPGKHAEVVGAVSCGDRLVTDWREKNGYIHLIDVKNETADGWVYGGYVVLCEPEIVNEDRVIVGGGRAACRKWIDGKRKGWAKNGSSVTVYAMADGWAVTDRGYIQSRFIGGAE